MARFPDADILTSSDHLVSDVQYWRSCYIEDVYVTMHLSSLDVLAADEHNSG